MYIFNTNQHKDEQSNNEIDHSTAYYYKKTPRALHYPPKTSR